jgi:hypothetical protein
MIFRRVPAHLIVIGGYLERDTMKRLCRANHSSKIEKFIKDGHIPRRVLLRARIYGDCHPA